MIVDRCWLYVCVNGADKEALDAHATYLDPTTSINTQPLHIPAAASAVGSSLIRGVDFDFFLLLLFSFFRGVDGGVRMVLAVWAVGCVSCVRDVWGSGAGVSVRSLCQGIRSEIDRSVVGVPLCAWFGR